MSDFLQAASLQSFFFDELSRVNQKHVHPLHTHYVFYASLIMERYALAESYFEEREGRVREKILGMRLLETSQMQGKKKKNALKDIGDTSLLLCGYFSDSLKRKLVDESYYQQIGTQAYKRLDGLEPQFLNQQSFFENLSKVFGKVAGLMTIVFHERLNAQEQSVLLKRAA